MTRCIPFVWWLLATGDAVITKNTSVSIGVLAIGLVASYGLVWWARGDRDAIVHGFTVFQTEVRSRFESVNERIDSMCRRLDEMEDDE
jgi:hypothetical protein